MDEKLIIDSNFRDEEINLYFVETEIHGENDNKCCTTNNLKKKKAYKIGYYYRNPLARSKKYIKEIIPSIKVKRGVAHVIEKHILLEFREKLLMDYIQGRY